MHLKIGSAQAASVSARGAAVIRELTEKVAHLTSERDAALAKIASMEREREIEAIAAQMEEKGLNVDLTFEEKVAHIQNHGDLSKVREAVQMASGGSIKLASISDSPGRASGEDEFAAWLTGA